MDVDRLSQKEKEELVRILIAESNMSDDDLKAEARKSLEVALRKNIRFTAEEEKELKEIVDREKKLKQP